MNFNAASFFSTPVANSGVTASPAQILLGGTGLLSQQAGLNFFDLLLTPDVTQQKQSGNLLTGITLTQRAATVDTPPVLNDPVLITDNADLEAVKFSLSNEIFLPEITTDSVEVLENGQEEDLLPDVTEKLAAILDHFLQSIPLENRQKTHFLTLQKSASKTTFDPGKNEDEQFPNLIAIPLDPQKLAQLIEDLRKHAASAEEQALAASLVKILPPEAKTGAIILPQIATITPKQIAPADNKQAENTDLSTDSFSLNSLTGADESTEKGYGRFLQMMEQARQNSGQHIQTYQPNSQEHLQNDKTPVGPALSTIHVQFPITPTQMSGRFSLRDIFPDGSDWSTRAGTTASGIPHLTLTGPSMAASLIGQTSSAASPHPATQIVASAITKMSADGQTKNMTVRLEPPELGRLEIRMEFSKEKSVKIHLMVEKQETYLMLQRDAHVLQRTLADSGLSPDGGGLSFELAQDNLFNQGREGGNDHSSYGGNTGQAADSEIIETTMSWNVDPDTGLTRYDILA